MSNVRIIGFVMLAVGLVLLYFGYTASESVASQVKSTFSGSMSDEAMLYYIGGAVLTGAGVFLGFFRK